MPAADGKARSWVEVSAKVTGDHSPRVAVGSEPETVQEPEGNRFVLMLRPWVSSTVSFVMILPGPGNFSLGTLRHSSPFCRARWSVFQQRGVSSAKEPKRRDNAVSGGHPACPGMSCWVRGIRRWACRNFRLIESGIPAEPGLPQRLAMDRM